MSSPNSNKQVILAIDPSGGHLAYTFITIDPGSNKAVISDVGMVWTKGTFARGQRFLYMFKCLEWLISQHSLKPTKVITEQFFMNPKLRMGVAVIPTINGFIELLCAKYGAEYNEFPPPTWRAALGIKHRLDVEGKRDYKTPTREVVEKTLQKLPDTVLSNITLKERAMPHDLTDSMAIGLAYCIKNNTVSFSINNNAFGTGIPNHLNQLL